MWRRRPTGFSLVLASVVLTWVLLAVFFPDLLAPRSPIDGIITDKLMPPSADYWFGTDNLGRDVYARTVHGTALSVRAAVIAVAIGFAIGVPLGVAAGYYGGVTDLIVSRFVDILLAIPGLLLSLTVIAALGPGAIATSIAVGIASIATFARISRAEVLRVRAQHFVEAGIVTGATRWGALRRHVLPNSMGPALAYCTLEIGMAILAVAALSFLGYGEPPPQPEWGRIVADGRNFIATSWWVSLLPCVVIALVVWATNVLSRVIGKRGGIA